MIIKIIIKFTLIVLSCVSVALLWQEFINLLKDNLDAEGAMSLILLSIVIIPLYILFGYVLPVMIELYIITWFVLYKINRR